MDLKLLSDPYTLLASAVWGGVAVGYLFYAKQHKSGYAYLGGAAMMAAATFLSALWMTVASLAIMYATWWLMKNAD